MLQGDVSQLCGWADTWQMDFNPIKCHVNSVTRKKTPIRYPYRISDVELEHVSHRPYLGVEIAADLSWGPHLNQTIPKAQRSLNLLRRNLYGCLPQTKEMAYKALVCPVLEYASSAWDVF